MSLESYLQKHPELTEKEEKEDLYEEYAEPHPKSSSSTPSAPSQPHKSRGCAWTIVILLLILILLGVTCPSRTDHQEALTEYAIKKSSKDADYSNAVSSTFGNYFTGAIATMYLSASLQVDNYVVFSVGKITDEDGETKTVSIGFLGHVFTP